MANYEKMYHIMFNAAQDAQRVAKLFIIRCPRHPAGVLFAFASGGHLSFNSERKVRKNATKTYGFGFHQRAAPCRKLASCSSRNRLSRVPLSVKRTVPPQLSATASLPLPVATAAASPSTAVPGYSPPNAAALVRTVIPSQSADWRGNPSLCVRQIISTSHVDFPRRGCCRSKNTVIIFELPI